MADASGRALATTPLGPGTTVRQVRATASERRDREDLVDSIYDLRIAKASGDDVEVARLRLERAQLRLHDLDAGPTPQPFEGHAFEAVWCRLTFAFAGLPPSPGYSVTVTHRGSTTYTSGQLAASGGR